MTDAYPRVVALSLLDEMEICLAAIEDEEDEDVRLRLTEQMGVLLGGISTLVDEDAGGLVDDLSDFSAWAEENGVEVHG